MSPAPRPSDGQRSGLRVAIVTALAGIAVGAVALTANLEKTSVVAPWAGETGAKASARTMRLTARMDAACRARMGLATDGGDEYVQVVGAGTVEGDGGLAMPELPPCLTALDDTEEDLGAYDGGAQFELTMRDAAAWECACGPGCDLPKAADAGFLTPAWARAGASRKGQTFQAGAWRFSPLDTGLSVIVGGVSVVLKTSGLSGVCVRKPCIEVAGFDSMPAACQ